MTNLRKVLAEINGESTDLLVIFSVTAGIMLILTLIFFLFKFSEKLSRKKSRKNNAKESYFCSQDDFVYYQQMYTTHKSMSTNAYAKQFSTRFNFTLAFKRSTDKFSTIEI